MRVALLFLAAVFCAQAQFFPFPGPGAIEHSGGGGGGGAVFKGESHQNQDTSASSISTPGTLNVAAGDLIVVLVGGASSPDVTCGSDTLTQAGRNDGGGYIIWAFYKENASANAAATCTAAFSSSVSFRAIAAVNYSGVVSSGSLKNISCNSTGCDTLAASSTSRTAQNVTTATANTLLIGCGVDWNGGDVDTAANGYTKRINGITPFLFDKNVSSTGTYPSGNFATSSPADQYMAFFLVFGAQ